MLRDLLGQPHLPVRLGMREIDSRHQRPQRMYDRVYGGFGAAGSGPKFPARLPEFLLDRLADPVDDATKSRHPRALAHA